ncbi:MAG: hypothetical protein ACT4P7_09100, partial [Gemmatimonadaceae bacterium]
VVRDAQGNPAAGVDVTFTITAGGGTLTGGTQTTGSDGLATLGGWTLGPTPAINTVVATAAGLPSVTFNVSTTGSPAVVAMFAGDNQAAVQGTAVTTRPAVIVTDGTGNGVPNTLVSFAVVSGGGSVTVPSVFTDASGVATVGSWTLGAGVPNQLTATVNATGVVGNPVTFTALAATKIVVTAIPASSGAAPATFQVSVQLQTAASTSAPVSGVALSITNLSSGAIGGSTTVTTGAGGAATFTISISTTGAKTLRISGVGLGTVDATINIT